MVEDFSILLGVLPLGSGQLTMSGGSSGLFSAFEPFGFPVSYLVC